MSGSPGHPQPNRDICVFISSTFRDMHAERDHLVTVVFPELRERLERLGLNFFDVDLRWGVPKTTVDGEMANSWKYCKQWIDRVEPFFVAILGQRYGWIPKPQDIRDDEDRALWNGRSVTEMEVRHAVLGRRLRRRSFFYLRQTLVPPPPQTLPDVYKEFVDTEPIAQGYLSELKREIGLCGRPVRPYTPNWKDKEFQDLDDFGKSVLEDLWSGVLRDDDVSKEFWRQAIGADPDTDPRYIDESQPVPPELWKKIVDLAKPEPKEPLDAERQQMDAFAASRLRWFQGRTNELRQLTDFLNLTNVGTPRLAVVAAVPGQGKSALLARLYEQLRSSQEFVIAHFVGATERSASAHALVERLLGELDCTGITWPAEELKEGKEPKRDFNSLCLRLAQRLGAYASERRLVILLDALNQLSDGHDLQWLPNRLGPSVRVIVSCVEDPAAKANSPEQRVLGALAARQYGSLRVPLGLLTEAEVRTIAIAYLNEYCHELDREHLDTLCAITQAHNPLYLLVMLTELRTLGGNDLIRIVPALIASMPQDHPDTVSLFRWVLQRLEVFNKDAPDAVRWWCLYLAHGRVGMSSHELSDLLARKLGAAAAATALRIERGLRRYLQRRGLQLDFFHGQLRQAVFKQYIGPQAETTAVHSDIAAYFRDRADPESKQRWQQNARLLGELPFHLAHGGRETELRELFSQLAFLAARVATAQVYEQVADYSLAGSPLPPALAAWHDFLQKHAQRLTQHPAMLVALVTHEGFPEARVQAEKVVWPHPWLRTSPERMPAGEVNSATGLHVQVTGNIGFPWGRASAFAPQRSMAFCFERLGVIRVFDLAAMRQTDVILSIRRDRPLVLACASDATSVVVFYESGKAELFRCTFGENDWPASLEQIVEFSFHLPETDDPLVVWHAGAFWYQATAGTLAYISIENPRAFVETLPVGQQGELSALVFTEGTRLVAMRQGPDTMLIASGAQPLRRQSTHVSTACACGKGKVAAAFTDGALIVFELAETLTAQAEIHAGSLRGALGWDGSRLLWTEEYSGFNAWCPGEASPLPVQDDEEVFPKRLHVLPRQWFLRHDGSILLGTTHSMVTFCILQGGVAAEGGLEAIFGGPVWRAVRKRGKDQWLVERQRLREMLLGRGVMGRLYLAVDGRGRFFAASGYGPGLVFDLSTFRSTPLEGCPLGINVAVGEDSGGCWFTDRAGDIYFADAAGRCGCAAKIGLPDVHGSHLENCGEHLVWMGYSSKFFPETGSDAARTLVFFNKTRGNPPKLQRLGEQFRHPGEGICVAICYDQFAQRLVTVWAKSMDGADSYSLRVGPVQELIRWQFQELDISGLTSYRFVQADLSADGQFLGVVNMRGEFSCLSVADGRVLTTIAGSAPFTAVAPGADGSEFWLVQSRSSVYRCALVEGTT